MVVNLILVFSVSQWVALVTIFVVQSNVAVPTETTHISEYEVQSYFAYASTPLHK